VQFHKKKQKNSKHPQTLIAFCLEATAPFFPDKKLCASKVNLLHLLKLRVISEAEETMMCVVAIK